MMAFSIRSLLPALLPVLFSELVPFLAAQDGATPVAFDLRAGSTLLDSCLSCGRKPVTVELAGTFTATAQPPKVGAQTYDLTDIDWKSPDGAYVVKGSGTYTIMVTYPTSARMELQVTINGGEEIALASKADAAEPWPFIDCAPAETAPTDLRDFSMRIIAAPTVDMVPYRLEKGSDFYFDCPPCMRPIVPIPVTGAFRMGKVDENSLFAQWRIDGLKFQDADGKLSGNGIGRYRQGGEVALVQEMVLLLHIEPADAAPLDVTVVIPDDQRQVPVALPAVQAHLAQPNPPSIGSVPTLDILASPAWAGMPFLRGDPNDDGMVDLSDAVFILSWLFLGEKAPGCMAAANANGDGLWDLTDVLVILGYLFLGGSEPPAPGPVNCGISDEPPPPEVSSTNCNAYTSCPGAN